MKWQGRRQSSNVDDQRGFGGRGGGGGGLLAKGGIGTVLIIIVISVILGKNPLTLLQDAGVSQNSIDVPQEQTAPPENDEQAQFVSVVLAETEDVWNSLLQDYREPTLVLF